MSKNKQLPYFSEWVKSREKLCKDRGVKLSSKNRKRLKFGPYLDLCIKEKGQFNGLLFAIYGDAINDLIPDSPSIFDRIKRKMIC